MCSCNVLIHVLLARTEAPPAPRPTRHAAQRAAAQPQPADAPPDPYAMLDMHDVGPWPQRPYVKKQPRRPAPPTGPAPLQLTLHTPAAAAGALALSDLAPVLRRLQNMLKAEQRAADAAAMAAEEEDVDDGVFGFADDVAAGGYEGQGYKGSAYICTQSNNIAVPYVRQRQRWGRNCPS